MRDPVSANESCKVEDICTMKVLVLSKLCNSTLLIYVLLVVFGCKRTTLFLSVSFIEPSCMARCLNALLLMPLVLVANYLSWCPYTVAIPLGPS